MKRIKFLYIITIILIALSCKEGIESDSANSTGTGGSLARFTIAQNALYTVSTSELSIFNISNIETIQRSKTEWVGFGAETLFPLGDSLLFMGTETGMNIYNISNPLAPEHESWFSHVRSCDPVVSDGKYAYLTLRSSETRCNRGNDELQIIDIQNLKNPVLVSTLPMNAPKGLAIRNDTLYVCDSGLKMIDVKNKQNPNLLKTIPNIEANDIIIKNDIAIVLGNSEINQYRINNGSFIKLSTIGTSVE